MEGEEGRKSMHDVIFRSIFPLAKTHNWSKLSGISFINGEFNRQMSTVSSCLVILGYFGQSTDVPESTQVCPHL